MKNIFLILSMFFLITACDKEKSKQGENLILGSWKLVSFVNELTNSTVSESDFQNSNQISIDFKEDMNFTGSTIRNNFTGNYSIKENNQELIFLVSLQLK